VSELFPTTRWTLILEAKDSPEARRAALEALLGTYWRPLFVMFRAKGLGARDAEDAVQDFCVQLLERNVIEHLAPERGRLRGFLRTAGSNFLANRHAAHVTEKRGGQLLFVPLDVGLGEQLVAQGEQPDAAFERAWARVVFEKALKTLQREYSEGGRTGPFGLVERFFSPSAAPPSYREVANEHGMSVPQLKSFLHRARGRFRQLVEDEVTNTVGSAADAKAEVLSLLGALSA
jgi:DNA-directed RNA polymerase specialized sigma24 family protein